MKKILLYLITVVCLLNFPLRVQAKEGGLKPEGSAISIALDTSGSMKTTDSERFSIELIKMFIDICGEEDFFNVTAYNDEIVYTSGMISMRGLSAREALKQDLDSIEFAGDTDNGLGLRVATQAIAGMDFACENSFVLLISDGNTDLENSDSGRTLKDSNEDIDESSQLAREHNIAINAIEYTGEYTKDTSLLSVVTAATGGGITLVEEPLQFIQVMLGTFFKEYGEGQADLKVTESQELLNRMQFSFTEQKNTRQYAIIFATEKIEDFEMIGDGNEVPYVLGEHYVVVATDTPENEALTAIYSFGNQEAAIVAGPVTVQFLEEQQTEEEPEAETVFAPPVGEDIHQEVYTSGDKLQIDVSQMFQDEDNDIVSYSVAVPYGLQPEARLSGSMLGADISKAGNYSFEIIAVDSHKNTATAKLTVEVIPGWKRYYSAIITGLVLVILAAAAAVCFLIVRRVLFLEKKDLSAISGWLEVTFIDIKSKNESVDARWNLEEYPPEGVSLQELFQSKHIMEDLKDLDKICFYPTKIKNELLLVHCMEGGVFMGEQLIRKNTPIKLQAGDTVYLSFADNASEIELKYDIAGYERNL